MSRSAREPRPLERRGEIAVTALVIAAFVPFWVFVFVLGDPPEHRSKYVSSAILVALLATPWVIAARILWRAWWSRGGAQLAALDGPARLLAVALATLPEERRDWAAAMAAELAHVQGRAPRWRFALGCARALATFRTARSCRAHRALPRALLRAAGTAGVAACIGATAYFLVEHPSAVQELPPSAAIFLAVALAACLGLAWISPRALTTSRLALGVGACAGVALGLGCVLTSRLTIDTLAGAVIWLMFAPAAIAFVASAAAAWGARSLRAGVQAAVWTTLFGTLLVFAAWLPEALHRYAIDARLLLDGERGHSIAENLGDAIWIFVAVPVLALPFGVIGAAVGAARWRPRRSREHAAWLEEDPRW